MKLQPFMNLHKNLKEPLDIGAGPFGARTIYYVTGGTFEGERLKGKVLSGGGDWILIDSEGVAHQDVRVILDNETKNWARAECVKLRWYYEEVTLANHCREKGINFIYSSQEDANRMREIAYNKIWPDYAAKNEMSAKAIEIVKDFHRSLGKPVPD